MRSPFPFEDLPPDLELCEECDRVARWTMTQRTCASPGCDADLCAECPPLCHSCRYPDLDEDVARYCAVV